MVYGLINDSVVFCEELTTKVLVVNNKASERSIHIYFLGVNILSLSFKN